MAESKENGTSSFGTVTALDPDKIFFTKQQFVADTAKVKYNLGIGAYRTKLAKPLVLNVVQEAEQAIAKGSGTTYMKEYFPIGGDAEFIQNAQKLILGKQYDAVAARGIAGVQGLSGTGSLRLLFALVKKTLGDRMIWLSKPTWGNHKKIIRRAGLQFDEYPYWNAKTKGLDFDGLMATLGTKAKKGDVVLLQACAHNPTGVDPTQEQWKKICELVKEKGLIPLFDSAYQGFATADLDNDAWSVQYFASQGVEFMIAQSFSKNLGLYNERIGCASVLCKSKEIAKAVDTQLRGIVRPMYSNPPSHGARIVNAVMKNNYKGWQAEMVGMSGQILQARLQLRYLLEETHGMKGQWKHITDQIGMFCFSGLTKDQVDRMKSEHHVYLLDSGRISMAGVAPSDLMKVTLKADGSLEKSDVKGGKDSVPGNVEYIAKAIAEVVAFAAKK